MALCKVLSCPSRYNAEYYLLLYRDWEYPHLHTVVKGATSVLKSLSGSHLCVHLSQRFAFPLCKTPSVRSHIGAQSPG